MLVYQRVAIFSFVTFKLQKHLPSTPAWPGEAPIKKWPSSAALEAEQHDLYGTLSRGIRGHGRISHCNGKNWKRNTYLSHKVSGPPSEITMLPFCSTFLCSYLCGVLLRLDFRLSNELLPITNKRTNIWCSTWKSHVRFKVSAWGAVGVVNGFNQGCKPTRSWEITAANTVLYTHIQTGTAPKYIENPLCIYGFWSKFLYPGMAILRT